MSIIMLTIILHSSGHIKSRQYMFTLRSHIRGMCEEGQEGIRFTLAAQVCVMVSRLSYWRTEYYVIVWLTVCQKCAYVRIEFGEGNREIGEEDNKERVLHHQPHASCHLFQWEKRRNRYYSPWWFLHFLNSFLISRIMWIRGYCPFIQRINFEWILILWYLLPVHQLKTYFRGNSTSEFS